MIHKSIIFSRKPELPDSGRTSFGGVNDDNHSGRHGVYHCQRVPIPTSSCSGDYIPPLGNLTMSTDTIIPGDFNANHRAWYSSSKATRDTQLENIIYGTNFGAFRQRQSIFPRCFISISLSYHLNQLADEYEPRLRPSTNPH